MAIFDLLQMSGNNLLRRKVRTLLTILGVVIGTASIVVMLSLGLGLKRTSMKQIEQSGGLTTIQVYPNEGMSDIAGNGDKKNMEVPKINAMKEQIFYIFDTEVYYAFKNPVVSSGEGESLTPPNSPKKYLLSVCGVLAGSAEEYSNHSYIALADIDALRTHLRKAFRNKAIPGQPTKKNGKTYKEIYYNSAYVRVDDMKKMEKVQKAITDEGTEKV